MPKWIISVFSLEIRKIIQYRAEFWINFFGQVFLQLTISYFLWKSIFRATNQTHMAEMKFEVMFVYFLCTGILQRALMGEGMGFLSREIYEGGLNKFLIYPIPALLFKLVTHMAHCFVYLCQLFVLLGVWALFKGLPEGIDLNTLIIGRGIISLLSSALLFFTIAACIEMIGFWADNVWSLMVILKFATNFFGGTYLPLALFPSWGQEAVTFTPFPSLINFPVKSLLGMISWAEWTHGMIVQYSWILVFFLLGQFIWGQGQKKYMGVGI